jgi:hypothetical protein
MQAAAMQGGGGDAEFKQASVLCEKLLNQVKF